MIEARFINLFSSSNTIGIDNSPHQGVGRLENGVYSNTLTTIATQVEELLSLPIRFKI